MLRLNKLTDYGTVITTHMARQPERVFAATELAAAAQVGVATASKVLKLLAGAGLVRSVRGAQGGYALARPAAAISLAEVIDALEGPPGLTECSVHAGLCAQERGCAIRGHWQAIDRVIRRALDETTLADMTRPEPVQVVAAPSRRRTAALVAGDES
jgi:FeS assembly SUF system regulator